MIKTLFLIPTPREKGIVPLKRILEQFEKKDISVYLPPEYARRIDREDLAADEKESLKRADAVLSLGGDGTLLRAARMACMHDIPIMGINLGGLGFLTEVSLEEADEAIKSLLEGRYRIIERIMLSASVMRNEKEMFSSSALNDVVLHRGDSSHLLHLKIMLSGRYAGSYAADGLIVSTPTGSTAYSLSSGGPIVNPDLDCFILTAICPHTLSARPLVIPSSEMIHLLETSSGGGMSITFDGQINFSMESGDSVILKKSHKSVKFINIKRDFYQIIREKLKWVE